MSNDNAIVEISLDQLHESPFNPRQRYTGIAELAKTMRPPNGRVLQPLLVRPRIPPLFAGGDADLAASAVTGYEVVFGHRRRRGAIEAGLATVPCMVKAMTDAEARHAQIIENLQREDLHPFEEAEGFAALLKDDGLTADEVAEQFGKSRSYVYGRLKLLQACPDVRDACLDGTFGTEVALLIARLGSVKIQQQALASVRNRLGNSHLVDGGKDSFRRVRDHLADKFSLHLKTAIFDPDDETLLPAAGACETCPKRSGNSPTHEDVAAEKVNFYSARPTGPNVCTDVECFGAKKAAHLTRKAAELAADGATVITGNKAKQLVGAINGTLKPGCGYVALQDVSGKLKKLPKGASIPATVTVLDQRTGKPIKAVKVAELPAALQPKEEATRGHSGLGTRDWQAEQRERQAKLDAERARRESVKPAIFERMRQGTGTLAELRLIAWLVLEQADHEHERAVAARYELDGRVARDDFTFFDHLGAEDLRMLLLDALLEKACDTEYNEDSNRAIFDHLAAIYGASAEGTSTPRPAGASAEEAAASADASQGAANGAKVKRTKKSQQDQAPAGADAEQTYEPGFAGEHAEAGA